MINRNTNTLGKSLTLYFSEIEKTKPLDPSEEIRLTKLVKQGDRNALNKIIESNLKFVVSVANKYRVTGIPLEDLINEGNIGLVKSAFRFDETRGFKFISYAVWWIRQSILQFIADQGRVVRLPANIANSMTKMKKNSEKLESALERLPTMGEIAELMEISEKEADKLIQFNARSLSTDHPLDDDEKMSMKDLLQSEDASPDLELMEDSLNKEIKTILKTIPNREAYILEKYFGINLDRPFTLEEIGDELSLTRERIRQLKERAIKRLKTAKKSKSLRLFLD
ncbi:MAG: RNA polymerase subunit sigma [Candidatus Marinimicrobia bacterium]|nr:RNA polymerase subunit sigma [Candidatus Neomarinimicrobiota bacterium]